jgi:DNA-directed RNA polymerase specialized sigma24 family protein
MALILRYVDQYSIEEVAQALGKSEAATHSLLTRSRDRFRARFGGRTR